MKGNRKNNMRYLILSVPLLFFSCDEEKTVLELGVPENVETKAIIPIVICQDAFVEVGGYSEYKGTHCYLDYMEMGTELEIGQYIPDGYPASAGGGSFSEGDDWYFNFHLLEDVYGQSSTLNLLEKDKLQSAIDAYPSQPEQYVKAYKWLITQDPRVEITFKMDTTLKDWPAQYDKDKKTISFRSRGDIHWSSVAEELLHVLQHQCFYGSTMSAEYKNYEFEVAVFRDLAFGIADKLALENPDLPYYGGASATFPYGHPYHKAYTDWLKGLIDAGYFNGNGQAEFNKFCSYWPAIDGKVLTTFTPQLLRKFFDKPQKPQNP